jgi:basic membrane lipoprotein Med (substrate-binding protein (PBP1-ABC) superfamily)
LFRALLALAFAVVSISPATSAEPKHDLIKVGFITVAPVSEIGWNSAHNQGRLYLEKTLPAEVKTTLVENVPETAEVERVMEKMIAQGHKVIFTTSYGYLEPACRVAKRHPDVIVLQCQRKRPPSLDNVATYFANQFEPTYIAGMVAGRMTHTNKIGFITAHPVPPVLACANALALGARSVNPKATVRVVFINTWEDPALEAEASKGLIEQGADVLACQLNSPVTVVKTAEKNHVYSIGFNSDLSAMAPKSWLVAQMFDWGKLYVEFIRQIENHTFKAGDYLYSMKDGIAKLSSYGPSVPPTVQAEANKIADQIKSQKFQIFHGPLSDRNGKVRIPAGKDATQQQIEQMDWVVPGVEGTLPSK